MHDKEKNLLIVGLGLIGGSYAKALKDSEYRVMAIDTNKESVDYAVSTGIVDEAAAFADPKLIEKADYIIISLYPSKAFSWIKENVSFIKKQVYISDVLGVKGDIIDNIQSILPDNIEYISAHPMAGREKSGVQNSDCSVFKNANYIVVPTKRNTEKAIDWCKNLGTMLGFTRISVLSPEEHDRMIAYVSQLTHCIAVSLMNCDGAVESKAYCGDSYRDLTRIANINADMWSELFIENKKYLVEEIDEFIEELTRLRGMIQTEDVEPLKERLNNSTMRRREFDKK